MRSKLDDVLDINFNWHGPLTKENAPKVFRKIAEWLTLCPTYTSITTNRGLTHAQVQPRNHADSIVLYLDDDYPWMQVGQEGEFWVLYAHFTLDEIRSFIHHPPTEKVIYLKWDKQVLRIDQHSPAGFFMEWIFVPESIIEMAVNTPLNQDGSPFKTKIEVKESSLIL